MRTEVVCFLLKDDHVLLSPKKRKFAGIWNGYGGKVRAGESIETCVVREVFEEAYVIVDERDMRKRAFVRIYEGKKLAVELHIFTATKWKGEPSESDEHGRPQWFPVDKLPFDRMFEDTHVWVPQVLAGSAYDVEVHFSRRRTRLNWVKFREPTF